MDNISVVGLGKLGQCLAACFAVRGFETIGVDINEKVVDSINRGVPDFPRNAVGPPGLSVSVSNRSKGTDRAIVCTCSEYNASIPTVK